PHRVSCVFLAGIRIYHVEFFYASTFFKKEIKQEHTDCHSNSFFYIKIRSLQQEQLYDLNHQKVKPN
ncbi:hypothetical protein ACINKY_29125, partial [Paenibacillus illinoisensis]